MNDACLVRDGSSEDGGVVAFITDLLSISTDIDVQPL